ncbi:hypothetical protein SZ43_06950 [Brachyspira hyodysenteriae]|uniref:hypothetical protein n=1 Tax=Brachyspira hyodysenteriae TaxID=159 RepID=UPI00063DCC7E|nr:hypothetical protein [Brachyspira hyodysenteriae]KLI53020.1 hypothetical protein SZ43_06950 [Brachyspira hyodysenteriae]
MYNSTIGYASKLIKGSIVFSIIIFISLSQLMAVTSIFSLAWKYEILLNENIPFFREFSIYALFIGILIIGVLYSAISSSYIFSKNSRMFSTLRIFGATKLAIRKLAILISLLYPLVSFLICIIEMLILYLRYSSYILTLIEFSDVINGAYVVLLANAALIIGFMIGAFISNSILLHKDPYDDLRGTL